jgi:hypothetical protein
VIVLFLPFTFLPPSKPTSFPVKRLVIVNKIKEILYISHPVNGKCHDFNVLKKMLSPDKKYFIEPNILVDLGFGGMDKQYDCKSVHIPHKKSKNKPLTPEQKVDNVIFVFRKHFYITPFAELFNFKTYTSIKCISKSLYTLIFGLRFCVHTKPLCTP